MPCFSVLSITTICVFHEANVVNDPQKPVRNAAQKRAWPCMRWPGGTIAARWSAPPCNRSIFPSQSKPTMKLPNMFAGRSMKSAESDAVTPSIANAFPR